MKSKIEFVRILIMSKERRGRSVRRDDAAAVTSDDSRALAWPTLGEVDRPYSKEFTLTVDGKWVMIDRKIALKAVMNFDRKRQVVDVALLVTREAPFYITTGEDVDKKTYSPEPGYARQRGQFKGTAIDIPDERPVFFVGKKFRVEVLGKTSTDVRFRLSSVRPIKATFYDNGENANSLLAGFDVRRSEGSISGTRRSRRTVTP